LPPSPLLLRLAARACVASCGAVDFRPLEVPQFWRWRRWRRWLVTTSTGIRAALGGSREWSSNKMASTRQPCASSETATILARKRLLDRAAQLRLRFRELIAALSGKICLSLPGRNQGPSSKAAFSDRDARARPDQIESLIDKDAAQNQRAGACLIEKSSNLFGTCPDKAPTRPLGGIGYRRQSLSRAMAKTARTSLASARRYSCCSGNSDNCRRAYRLFAFGRVGSCRFARSCGSQDLYGPCANGKMVGLGRRHEQRTHARPAERDDCAKIRQSPIVARGRTAAVDFRRHRLVCGGTQRTALVIAQETSRKPSLHCAP